MFAILSGSPLLPYSRAMDNVILPPELERFATEAVAAGHYRDVSDVVAAGVTLLQRGAGSCRASGIGSGREGKVRPEQLPERR